ncbi:MAG TPA: FAD-dependent oxidoreductase [Solirubrobacterales bacterium]|nr:FAD-dependent oxidoreductase [Solirubrobacterales bacterium]
MEGQFSGHAFARGEDGYEEARRAAVWNARTPERHPDLIVQAKDGEDLVAAVRMARERGWKIGVRSGGHSWAGNHVRDGGLLLDASGLDSVEIDAEAMTAIVGPGARGNDLLETLAARDLFPPATAPGWLSAVICCRGASAGTGGSTAPPA